MPKRGSYSRPLYKRGMDLVVVRRIRRGRNSILEPGTPLVPGENIRPYMVRELYQRRRVGPVGHPWTEAMLANQSSHYRPEATGQVEPKGMKRQKVDEPPVDHASIVEAEDGKWTVAGMEDPPVADTYDDLVELLLELDDEDGEKVDLAADLQQSLSEAAEMVTPEPVEAASEPGAQGGESAEATEPKIVKDGSQWVIEGHPDMGKFPSKKKAAEAWEADDFG